MQGYYFDTLATRATVLTSQVWRTYFGPLEVEFLKFVFFVLRVGYIMVRWIYRSDIQA